jgi:Na+/H+ antiporter NhaD/arsenite permease-like protein
VLSIHLSLTAVAVAALVLRPRNRISAAVVAAAAALDIALGARVTPALAVVAPLVRYGAPLAPLVLGAVAVANAASIAVPQGNPTNLVVINHLRLSPTAFTGRRWLRDSAVSQ